MIETIFPKNFYYKFTPPNSKDLINFLSKNVNSNRNMHWDQNCLVNAFCLSKEDWKNVFEYLTPSLDMISKEFSYTGSYEIDLPWLNHYSFNGFQELHIHPGSDLSLVFFINDGKNFGQFYFYDRMSIEMPEAVKQLVDYESCFYPEIKSGQFIVFPSTMLHGVTPHKSKEIRKTFALNLNLIRS